MGPDRMCPASSWCRALPHRQAPEPAASLRRSGAKRSGGPRKCSSARTCLEEFGQGLPRVARGAVTLARHRPPSRSGSTHIEEPLLFREVASTPGQQVAEDSEWTRASNTARRHDPRTPFFDSRSSIAIQRLPLGSRSSVNRAASSTPAPAPLTQACRAVASRKTFRPWQAISRLPIAAHIMAEGDPITPQVAKRLTFHQRIDRGRRLASYVENKRASEGHLGESSKKPCAFAVTIIGRPSADFHHCSAMSSSVVGVGPDAGRAARRDKR